MHCQQINAIGDNNKKTKTLTVLIEMNTTIVFQVVNQCGQIGRVKRYQELCKTMPHFGKNAQKKKEKIKPILSVFLTLF